MTFDEIAPPPRPRAADPRTQVPAVLAYLQLHLPSYPFDADLDIPFVEELADDFPDVDILEQVKTFRWYYDNEPLAHVKGPRVKLRRWITGAAGNRERW